MTDMKNIYKWNDSKIQEGDLQPGDFIEFERIFRGPCSPYSHFAIYAGNMEVIEVRLDGVRKTHIHEAVGRSRWRIKADGAFEKTEVLNRAEKELRGQGKFINYNLLSSNCEHVGNYCAYGVWVSSQVENKKKYIETIYKAIDGEQLAIQAIKELLNAFTGLL